jgi:hypothetical protein
MAFVFVKQEKGELTAVKVKTNILIQIIIISAIEKYGSATISQKVFIQK